MLQAVPGHFLGRLAQALSCSLLDQDQPAEAPLQPTQLAPGPLGIASAACGFIQVTQGKLKEVGCFASSNYNLFYNAEYVTYKALLIS